jgi:hypothetical protein
VTQPASLPPRQLPPPRTLIDVLDKVVDNLALYGVIAVVAIAVHTGRAEVKDLILALFGGLGFGMIPRGTMNEAMRRIGPAVFAVAAAAFAHYALP